jgi:AraC-like DNA-binding protein
MSYFDMTAHRSKDRQDTLLLGTSDASCGPIERPQPHAVEVNYVVSGEIKRTASEGELIVPPGQLVVFWDGGFYHLTPSSIPTPYYWIRIPLEEFLNWSLPPAFKQAILAGHAFIDSRRNRKSLDLSLFESWLLEGRRGFAGVSRWTMLEIEARLGRLADAARVGVPHGLRQPAMPGRTGMAAAAQIAQYLNQHYQEPVYWGDVAKVVGLSRPYARRFFQRAYGVTLYDYLLQLRLARAKQLLTTTKAKVIDIALETGFATQSNFYRAFEEVVGQTPSAYRRRLSLP